MNKILIYSQDGKFTSFCRSIGIGARRESGLIGEKLNELLINREMSIESLIGKLGNSYRDTITRILADKEIPNEKMVKKLVNLFEVEEDYFKEKELENVIITDNGIVVGKYETNARAIEVKEKLDAVIKECHLKGLPIVLEIPKE